MQRAASFAGINMRRSIYRIVDFRTCAAFAGVIYDAFYRSFIPTAGQLRELDAISSIIIGGGSIFGGYGTMIGSLAGAGVITSFASCSPCRSSSGTAVRSFCRSNGRTCLSA